MLLWSFAQTWPLPRRAARPLRPGQLGPPTHRACSTPWSTRCRSRCAPRAVALVLAVACLESESRRDHPPTQRRALWLAYAPLLVPQIAFLYGFQVSLVTPRAGRAAGWRWHGRTSCSCCPTSSCRWPTRGARSTCTLRAIGGGARREPVVRVLLRVRLPLVLRPTLVAVAIGFAVSVGQYLPTLFAGAGRVATLTTEAVDACRPAPTGASSVCSPSCRRHLPLAVYVAAIAIPGLVFRHRRRGWRERRRLAGVDGQVEYRPARGAR